MPELRTFAKEGVCWNVAKMSKTSLLLFTFLKKIMDEIEGIAHLIWDTFKLHWPLFQSFTPELHNVPVWRKRVVVFTAHQKWFTQTLQWSKWQIIYRAAYNNAVRWNVELFRVILWNFAAPAQVAKYLYLFSGKAIIFHDTNFNHHFSMASN